jgi:glycosyltransferase involved in cell wall biosynthesis
MKTLLNLNRDMNILILSRYGRLGASSRVRFYQYLDYFADYGIQVEISHLLSDEYIRKLYSRERNGFDILLSYFKRLKRYLKATPDLIWLEKEALPMIPYTLEKLLFYKKILTVTDYDDAVFHNYDENSNLFIKKILGQKIDEIMRDSDAVTVGNDYLSSRAIKAGSKHVFFLPTVVDLERYTIHPQLPNEKFTVGWIGSPATSKFVMDISDVLEETETILNGNFRLQLIGSGKLSLPVSNLDIVPWHEETEVEALSKIDVGIMPLRDEPFERGKCGYKLIQYMALGKPVIASPVGVNSEIVEHGVNGFLATTKSEWLEAFQILQSDPELRHRMGLAGRHKIEKTYSLQANAPRVRDLFLKLVAERQHQRED